MRLIDVSALKEWVKNWLTVNRYYHPYSKRNDIPIDELYDILDRMPTAEPRIIRCKDCKHWTDENDCYCDIWDHYISNDEFFCGCGERRETDGSD